MLAFRQAGRNAAFDDRTYVLRLLDNTMCKSLVSVEPRGTGHSTKPGATLYLDCASLFRHHRLSHAHTQWNSTVEYSSHRLLYTISDSL
ncbi:hypothetical protein KC19_12G175200 [Ceratodon purpureus]|uniref:Uncharacterized protein n=1 Tax=Ceratodon purpureus TaxID=3225 RepID=A0A8T0GAX7_CERPU|nr:hypothetical protein KC19_12G175200 [Ceratodon purpureus]